VRDIFIVHAISADAQTHKQTDTENIKQSYDQPATCFTRGQLVKIKFLPNLPPTLKLSNAVLLLAKLLPKSNTWGHVWKAPTDRKSPPLPYIYIHMGSYSRMNNIGAIHSRTCTLGMRLHWTCVVIPLQK